MEKLKTEEMECQIEEILDTPEQLQAHRDYMRSRFDLRLSDEVRTHIEEFFDLNLMDEAMSAGIPIAMQIGSVKLWTC